MNDSFCIIHSSDAPVVMVCSWQLNADKSPFQRTFVNQVFFAHVSYLIPQGIRTLICFLIEINWSQFPSIVQEQRNNPMQHVPCVYLFIDSVYEKEKKREENVVSVAGLNVNSCLRIILQFLLPQLLEKRSLLVLHGLFLSFKLMLPKDFTELSAEITLCDVVDILLLGLQTYALL